jgi:hypothetical protein
VTPAQPGRSSDQSCCGPFNLRGGKNRSGARSSAELKLDALRCAGVSKYGGLDAPAASLARIREWPARLVADHPGASIFQPSLPIRARFWRVVRMERIEPGEKRFTLKNSRVPPNNAVVKGSQSFFPGESDAFKSV